MDSLVVVGVLPLSRAGAVALNLLHNVYEDFAAVLSGHGRAFVKLSLDCLGEILAVPYLHLPIILLVALAPHDDHLRVDGRILARGLDPQCAVVEGDPIRDVIHDHDSVRAAVVRVGQSPEALLSGRVPHLHLVVLLPHEQPLALVVDPHCGRLLRVELVLRETQHEAGLADREVPDQQDFVDVL